MADKIEWSKMKPSEVEAIIVEEGKKGLSPEKIGLVLRDKHAVPKAKAFGLKIRKVLQKNNLKVLGEEERLTAKIEKLNNHNKNHKHDYMPKRRAVMYGARIRKIKKKN
jgi:ribosomal protein S15P/S13E